MARGRPGGGSKARAPAENEIATATALAPNGNGPAKAYRHKGEKRRNIPPAAIAAEGKVPAAPKLNYSYGPRLDPILRFDPTGAPDKLPYLLEKAKREPLTEAEARLLAEALRRQEPWLEWAGKREANGFAVDPVALHIHERVSTQAILKIAARKDVTRDLFADPQFDYHQAVQFYRHEMDWSNRLILGDSLQVMASLAQREDLAGKVQMIYVDPPYGVKFASNFQPEIGRRDVTDKEQDLTREAEMVKAYRDTWRLGIHSYLSYLRDRLVVARNLLADTGSIFVQISDDNLHRVRNLLDDLFGLANFCAVVGFQKTGSMAANLLPSTVDYLLWYTRDISKAKYFQIYERRLAGATALDRYDQVLEHSGAIRRLTNPEAGGQVEIAGERMQLTSLFSDGASGSPQQFKYQGLVYEPKGNAHWKTGLAGLARLRSANRIEPQGDRLRYVRFARDLDVVPISDRWESVQAGKANLYAAQTATKVIERCVLMTTDPGELVLDPTCGSGTTAYVAEQWGRRWITIDTSRIALAIARQRLLTAKFDYYELKDDAKGVAGGFKCKTVPHITLKSIAQNTNLDPIFAKHEPILDKALAACNDALAKAPADLKTKLATKLISKQRTEGKRAVTDADRRRWLLPPDNREKEVKLTVDAKFRGWYHWEVPFDTDPDWPKPLQDAVTAYRAAWHTKMYEVNACIQANAEPEELVNQPDMLRGIIRVSGPFSVEAVQPQEFSLDESASPIGGAPEPDEQTFHIGKGEVAMPPAGIGEDREADAKNADTYIDNMIRLLHMDGVRFPDNKEMKFTRLDPMGARSAMIHAEGRWMPPGETDPDPEGRATVCVAFGPQYGPVTAAQVEMLIRASSRRGYDDLLIAGFAFDGPAQTVIEEADHPSCLSDGRPFYHLYVRRLSYPTLGYFLVRFPYSSRKGGQGSTDAKTRTRKAGLLAPRASR